MDNRELYTLSEVKKNNRKRVFDYLFNAKTASRLEIANALNISLPTVSSSLTELIGQGLAEKCGILGSTGGRKAQNFCCKSLAKIAIGVEVRKEGIQIVAVDLYGTILREEFSDRKFENTEVYFAYLGSLINKFVRGLPYSYEQNLGVGITLQGLVSPDGEVVSYSEILRCSGLRRENFQNFIDYPVYIMHDTKAAAEAEVWYRDDITDAVYIALNRNFGGTLILNGTVADDSRSGLIEHMNLVTDGELCYCGKYGCVETVCSVDSLRKKADMDLGLYFDNVHNGDMRCTKIWKEYLRYLAKLIDNVRMVINCDFIIGGYLLKYMNDSDISLLTEYVNDLSVCRDYSNVEIKVSKNGEKAPQLGAAIFILKKFLDSI